MMSEDGGRNFSMIGGDIHPDHHAMWIDPENPNRILEGNDGGFYISRDRGRSWETMNVIPLGQFYQIGADMRDPYYVCGGLQDNGIWCGPSTTRNTPGILNDDWQIIHFGDGYYTKPYIYKTTDFGETWTSLRNDLPEFGFLHVVREDPKKSDLLYVGSEFGIFASFDDGRRWVPLHGDSLPPVPVRDIVIHPRDNDLIIGTHGRSIWILDDVTPLQQLSDAAKDKVFLFASMPATRYTPRFTKPFLADQTFHGEGAPNGAVVSYYLGAEPGDDETVNIRIGRKS